jgi:hypothetical protein
MRNQPSRDLPLQEPTHSLRNLKGGFLCSIPVYIWRLHASRPSYIAICWAPTSVGDVGLILANGLPSPTSSRNTDGPPSSPSLEMARLPKHLSHRRKNMPSQNQRRSYPA